MYLHSFEKKRRGREQTWWTVHHCTSLSPLDDVNSINNLFIFTNYIHIYIWKVYRYINITFCHKYKKLIYGILFKDTVDFFLMFILLWTVAWTSHDTVWQLSDLLTVNCTVPPFFFLLYGFIVVQKKQQLGLPSTIRASHSGRCVWLTPIPHKHTLQSTWHLGHAVNSSSCTHTH